jgi:DNA-binding NarL/FixJ family response regulator
MLTATEDADLIIKALSAGFSGYMLKDANVAEVLALVRNVYEGGSPISNHVARRIVSLFHRRFQKQEPLSALSRRERQVLELLARGSTYAEIAQALTLSKCTVATFIRRIFRKLQVNSRSKAVALLTKTCQLNTKSRIDAAGQVAFASPIC